MYIENKSLAIYIEDADIESLKQGNSIRVALKEYDITITISISGYKETAGE